MPLKKRLGSDPSNTAADGHYIVGKGRPPKSGQFKKDDGRARGRRPKGAKNLASDLREELASRVTVTVGGVQKKVSRQRAIVMRLADNATKGQNSAIALTLEYQQTLVDPALEREAQQKLAKPDRDMTHLSCAELEVLLYILAKIDDNDYENKDIIGIIPVYRDGFYLCSDANDAIEAGLKSYGIEITRSLYFPPKCQVIN